MTSPMNSSGVTTTTFMTGSSRTGLAFLTPACSAMEPAILNAISLRVDFVVGAVVELGLDVDHRVAGDDAVTHGFFDALLDRLDVFTAAPRRP